MKKLVLVFVMLLGCISVEAKEKQKFGSIKISTPVIVSDWMVIKSSIPVPGPVEDISIEDSGQVIGKLNKDGTFEGNAIKCYMSLIVQVLQLQEKLKQTENQLEYNKEDYYILRRAFREKK